MNNKEILLKAADRLRTVGWTQYAVARTKDGAVVEASDPQAVCYCLLGAIRSVMGDDADSTGLIMTIKASPIYPRLADGRASPLVTWNDTPGRTMEEVATLLENVAKEATMTAFFVQKFKRQHQCRACKKDVLSGYSLCPTHLERARARFANWAHERRSEGKCCYCDRKSFRGWLRCRAHTEINRAKCRAWMAAHSDHNRQEWEKRKRLQDLGRCPSCAEHRKLAVGFRRCNVCRARARDRSGLTTHQLAIRAV